MDNTPKKNRATTVKFAALALGGIVAILAQSQPRSVLADDLRDTSRQLQADFAADVDALAAWCQQQGFPEQADATRAVLCPQDPYKLYLPVLPEEVDRPLAPEGSSPEQAQWARRLSRLRTEHARELFEIARGAIHRNQPSLAFELVLRAIHADPDHEAVRRVLGYQKYQGHWRTVDEVQRLRSGEVWHERFGWLPRAHVRRYEQGQRWVGGRWVDAKQAASLHADIRNGWLVETEHYAIRTNASLEAGVALAGKLELLRRLWGQIFVRYHASAAQVKELFAGRARRNGSMPPMKIAFFRDRDDYVRMLQPSMPNIEISIGAYIEHTRRAYFFAGDGYDDRTLFHEATHQLFHQSRPVPPNVGRKGNFWIIEGIAMYMESLRREGDYYVLGGVDDSRMVAARYRRLVDDFYVPLEEFTAMGMEPLQTHPRVATLYSQAAGLAHFLIHYDGGRYRDALVAYLSTVYAGRDTPNTLAQLTGTSYRELDRQYREFLVACEKQARAEP